MEVCATDALCQLAFTSSPIDSQQSSLPYWDIMFFVLPLVVLMFWLIDSNQTHLGPLPRFESSDRTRFVWMLNFMHSSSPPLFFWDPIRCTYPTQSCWLEARVRLFVQREEAWEKRAVVEHANTLHWARRISIQASSLITLAAGMSPNIRGRRVQRLFHLL